MAKLLVDSVLYSCGLQRWKHKDLTQKIWKINNGEQSQNVLSFFNQKNYLFSNALNSMNLIMVMLSMYNHFNRITNVIKNLKSTVSSYFYRSFHWWGPIHQGKHKQLPLVSPNTGVNRTSYDTHLSADLQRYKTIALQYCSRNHELYPSKKGGKIAETIPSSLTCLDSGEWGEWLLNAEKSQGRRSELAYFLWDDCTCTRNEYSPLWNTGDLQRRLQIETSSDVPL